MGIDSTGFGHLQTGSTTIRRINDFRYRGHSRGVDNVLDIKRAQLKGPGSYAASCRSGSWAIWPGSSCPCNSDRTDGVARDDCAFRHRGMGGDHFLDLAGEQLMPCDVDHI